MGRDLGGLHLFRLSFFSLRRLGGFITDCAKFAGSAWRFEGKDRQEESVRTAVETAGTDPVNSARPKKLADIVAGQRRGASRHGHA